MNMDGLYKSIMTWNKNRVADELCIKFEIIRKTIGEKGRMQVDFIFLRSFRLLTIINEKSILILIVNTYILLIVVFFRDE